MPFDEASVRSGFHQETAAGQRLPDDLLARYAITLPATDAEIAAQLKAVRAYWNKTYSGKCHRRPGGQDVPGRGRAAPRRARPGDGEARLVGEAAGRSGSRRPRRRSPSSAEELRQGYGQLGVVTGGIVEKFAARLGLSGPQAAQAVERAGLTLVDRDLAAGVRADRRLRRPAQELVGMRRRLRA